MDAAVVGDIYKGIAWIPGEKDPIAICPEHSQRLEIKTKYGRWPQDAEPSTTQQCLICPEGSELFSLGGVQFWMLKRRYQSAKEAQALKGAKFYDLDNLYTPVLRVAPRPKDPDLSLQVEIDRTPEGKKVVIYAADRKDTSAKSHIFVDPQKESATFDGKDLHPNAIFAKVEITFKSGKKVILEDGLQA